MITEDQLEQLCLDWFESIDYDYVCDYDITSYGNNPERIDYRQFNLFNPLLTHLQKINTHTQCPVVIC